VDTVEQEKFSIGFPNLVEFVNALNNSVHLELTGDLFT